MSPLNMYILAFILGFMLAQVNLKKDTASFVHCLESLNLRLDLEYGIFELQLPDSMLDFLQSVNDSLK